MKEFTIPVRPQPKQRPRVGKYGNVYTPNETQEYEALVKTYAQRAGIEMTLKPVGIEVIFYFKDKRTPDLDNCAKAILDGLQGVAYKNDKQVIEQHYLLDYSENERAEVKIWEL